MTDPTTDPVEDDTAPAEIDARGPGDPSDGEDTGPEREQERPETDQADDELEDEPKSKAGRDAARYRRELRTVQAERDQLRDALTEYRRTDVAALAAEAGLADGHDLLMAYPDRGVEAFLGEDGKIDREAVAAVAKQLLRDRPHWGKPTPPSQRPSEALRVPAGGSDPTREPDTTWADVLGAAAGKR